MSPGPTYLCVCDTKRQRAGHLTLRLGDMLLCDTGARA